MMKCRAFAIAIAAITLTAPRAALGQERGAVALDQLLRGLPVTARVLMIGAHPDDEDTQMLAGLARGHQVQTAYLSLTRGDGGQNVIGNELGEALGAIRTEELLAARRIDGGHQYFSRAYDFGFSKNAEETFRQWDREALTADVVRVIRAFRPHVVIAVWTGTRADGHGHHEASGILARDAFDAVMDTVRFPVATNGRVWMPLKFYRSARGRSRASTLSLEVGGYDPVLGRSAAELAAESRSQHRSQGQGTIARRGSAQARVARELSRVNESTPASEEQTLFDGIDTSLTHLASLGERTRIPLVQARVLIDSIGRVADLREPAPLVPLLAQLVARLADARAVATRCGIVPRRSRSAGVTSPAPECSQTDLELDTSIDLLTTRAQRALLAAAGIAFEVTVPRELLAFADSMPVTVAVYDRGKLPLTIESVRLTGVPPRPIAPVTVLPDSSVRMEWSMLGLVDHRPWWIGGRDGTAMFADTRSPEDGAALISYGPDAPIVPSVSVPDDLRRITDSRVTLTIAGVTTTVFGGEVMYRFADDVLGEEEHPAGGVPPITLALDRGLEFVRADQPIDRRVRLTLTSHTERERRLALRYLLPRGLRIEGAPDTLVLAPNETRELFVRMRGTLPAGRHEFGIGAESEGTVYTEGFREIDYSHIRPIRLYHSSAMYLQSVPVTVPRDLVVAYVTGVSDAIAPALRQLEIRTTVVTPEELPLLDLARYTTVVIGPRAYATQPELVDYNPRLLEWVRNGGTLVVQYGQYEMATSGLMPFPVGFTRPAARVTIEEAPANVLDPASKLLTWPNRLTAADWGDWVQERGLYMPSEIDPGYRTPLEMHDPGEPENRGAILDATVGKGRYVYTSLSIFRQVPAGVPGSVRLLVNLLSAGLTQR